MMMRLLFCVLLILASRTIQAQYVDRTKVTEAIAATATLQSAATANGNGSTFDISGYSSLTFVITGTFTATVNFEATGDDTSWVALQVVQVGTSAISTTSTSAGTFSASIGSLKTVRARISGYGSGSVTVVARANLAQGAGPQVVTSSGLNVNVTDSATRDLGKVDIASLDQYTPVSGRLPVDGSGVTQPVSASSLPLPTGAATSTKQSDGSQKTQVVDGSGNVVGATSNALDVNIKSGNPTSITANAGTNLNTSALALSATQTDGTQKTRLTDGTNDAAVKAASTAAIASDKALVVAVSPNNTVGVTGTFWQATQPVSIAAAVSTNATIQNASLPVTQSTATNLKAQAEVYQGGTAVSSSAPLQVSLANTGANSTAVKVDASSFTVTTSNVNLDATVVANDATLATKTLLTGVEASSSQPAAATTGNQRRLVGSLDGALYVRQGGPVMWTCGVSAIAASLTQCQAAPGAGLKLYITGLYVQTTTTTSGTYALQTGTGSNCATGTAALFPVSGTANRFNAPITSNAMASIVFPVPIAAPANTAICLIGVATNTISAQIVGFTAP